MVYYIFVHLEFKKLINFQLLLKNTLHPLGVNPLKAKHSNFEQQMKVNTSQTLKNAFFHPSIF